MPNPIPFVDLRSDTVTKPTPEMREAMFSAPLGDDVLGDDPTVIKLEETAAARVGKEAGLYVPSGTMGNQIAIACHADRGDSILAEENAHILYYEVGGPAILAGVVTRTVPSVNGVMSPEAIESRIMKRSLHTPGTSLIAIENTHNRAGGTITPLSTMKEIKAIGDSHRIPIHLDGARVFNASVALGVDVKEVTQHVDSVSFCLSKGLRAPIGSVLCGSSDLIEKARVWRKRLGGGMRQSGLIAAAGLYALDHYVDRLAEDHQRARDLATRLNCLKGLSVDMATVQTNIVMVRTESAAQEWANHLEAKGVKCFAFAANQLRLVFHADVDDEGVKIVAQAFQDISSSTQ